MTEQNHLSRVWDIIERARIGMLTTQFSGGLRARPLEMRADSDVGLIWFLTDVRGAKDGGDVPHGHLGGPNGCGADVEPHPDLGHLHPLHVHGAVGEVALDV